MGTGVRMRWEMRKVFDNRVTEAFAFDNVISRNDVTAPTPDVARSGPAAAPEGVSRVSSRKKKKKKKPIFRRNSPFPRRTFSPRRYNIATH